MTQQQRPDYFNETSPQSAELFHLIVENIKDYAIFMTDADGRVVSWNPGVERLLGYAESEIIGQPIEVIFLPEDVAAGAHRQEMETAARAGRAEDKRWHRRKDGSRFWANGTVISLRTDDGGLRGFAKMLRDETTQKSGEEQIRQSFENVENTLERINDGFYALDNDWRFTYINRQSERLTGRSREELLGKNFWEEFPATVGTNFEENYRRAVREQTPVTFEDFYAPLNGWFELRAYPSSDGLSIYFHDITAHKRRETNLVFLAELQKDFARYITVGEITRTAGKRISEHLNLSHCLFVEINETANEADVFYDYHAADIPNLVGIYRLGEFHTAEEVEQLSAGKPIVINNVRDISRSAAAAAEFEMLGIRSLANSPYISDGRWKFTLSAQRGQPYQWRDDELELLNELAARVYLRLERARAEEIVRESEERFRALQQATPDGFMIFESVRDRSNKIADFRWIYVNPAAERIVGRLQTDLIGKYLCEEMPGNRVDGLFDEYVRVVETESVRRQEFSYRHENLDNYFVSTAVRVGDGFAVGFSDITERKQAELNLVFLAEISQDLARLASVNDIMQTVGAKIGAYLNLSICNFIEINEPADKAVINFSWHRPDIPSPVGVYRIAEFVTDDFQKTSRAGEIFIVGDTQTDERTDGEKYAARRIGAILTVPYIRDERWRFLLAVYHSVPHEWRSDEIELLRELTTRVWTRLERARAEEIIRDSQQKLRTALEAGKMGSWELNLGSGVMIASDTCKKNYGRQPDDELTYQDLTDSIHPDDRAVWRETIDKAIERCSEFETEYRVQWRDNSIHWVLVRGNCFADEKGTTNSLAGVSIDITARKQTEERMRERARIDSLYGSIGNALVRTESLDDLLNRCANALVEHLEVAFARIWTLDEAGKSLELRASAGLYTHLDGAHARIPVGKFKIGLIAEERQPHLTNEVLNDPQVSDKEWARREGMVAFAGYPLILEGRIVGVMGVFSRRILTNLTLDAMESVSKGIANVIERKRIEEERQRLLTSEQEARRAAENANRLKDEFLATLSHELRTPLNAILGWSQMLQTKNLNEDDVKKALSTIERNARSQNQLIDDLLDVSRIITGKLRLDVRSVDLVNVIATAIDAARPAAEAKNIRLQTLLDPQAGPISGDPDRLQQIVWNLLSNAVKFTPKGGRVQVRLERVNSHVEIVVSDTGKGIEAEFLPHVFDRFRQSDGSMTRRYGGLGLGLAIARQLVELHGGTISAVSAGDEQGATFTVDLPLLPVRREASGEVPRVHPAARNETETDCSPELSDLRVLLVDDEADSRELLNLVLESCGAKVTAASSAAEALEKLNDEKFDVIVSDIGMPEEDGFELIGKIRSLSNERGGGVPAIALTAYARTEDRVQALRAGFQMHIAKPVEPAELVVAVANLAGRMRKPNL